MDDLRNDISQTQRIAYALKGLGSLLSAVSTSAYVDVEYVGYIVNILADELDARADKMDRAAGQISQNA